MNNTTSAVAFRPYPDMVHALFNNMSTHNEMLMHAAIGICGEAGELLLGTAERPGRTVDYANVLEEMGDARFYMQKLFNVFGWELTSFGVRELYAEYVLDTPVLFAATASDILDVVKKTWVYGKELDALVLYDHMNKLVFYYGEMLLDYGYTDEQVTEANQLKLGKRYPEGVYSNEAAIERADKEDPNAGALAA